MSDASVSSSPPLVYAVVLNWNGWSDTVLCLSSLWASDYPNLRVLVIDNGSTDGSAARLSLLLSTSPRDELVRVERNLGFTGGANLGMRLALERGAAYVFLLNNDAAVAPDSIRLLVEALEAHPQAGLAGPRILWAAEPERVWSGGMSVCWHRAAVPAHRNEPDSRRFDGCRLVQGLSACALLVRREVLERVGPLDERYFAYYEDLDWCLRARQAGFRCLFAGAARAYHAGSASSNRGAGPSQSPLLNYYGARNGLLFMATHAPAAIRPLALASMGARLLAAAARIVAGGLLLRRPGAARRVLAIAAGVRDALRGHFGERYGVMP